MNKQVRKAYRCDNNHKGWFFHDRGFPYEKVTEAMHDQHEADHPGCRAGLVMRADLEDANSSIRFTPQITQSFMRQDRATL